MPAPAPTNRCTWTRAATASGLGIGGTVAIAGTAGISPSLTVPVLEGTTSAIINGQSTNSDVTVVNAARDVEVAATANAEIIAVAAGIAVAGTAGIAGSVAVVSVDTTTEAAITGYADVAATGNVLVTAFDVTTAYTIAGGIGIGFEERRRGGGDADQQEHQCAHRRRYQRRRRRQRRRRSLGQNSLGDLNTPQSIRGVAVQAPSSENLTNVGASGAGGLYVGIAGGIDVEETNSNTVAAIRNGAQVNENDINSANAQQSVAVGARDDLTVVAVAGALAGGAAGIGAGADIEVIRNNAAAFIAGGADVRAASTVDVDALTTRNITSVAISAGAGAFGLGGGITVISVGGGFNATYGGDGSWSNALSGPNNGDVLTSIDQNLNTAIAAIVQPNSGGLPAVNPSTAVDNTNHTIEFGTADNLATGNAVASLSGGAFAPINGLQDGHTYFVIADGPNKIQLAATYNDALAGNAIPITTVGTTGTNHTFSDNAAT